LKRKRERVITPKRETYFILTRIVSYHIISYPFNIMKPRFYNKKPSIIKKDKPNPNKKKVEPEKKQEKYHLTDDLRSMIRENAYIGTNGYTIPKSAFNSNSQEKELIFLRESLTMEPKKDGYCPTTALAPVSFPVFRENASKIYLPQFYGIERYGMPKNKLSFGDDISVPFVKPIRDYQEAIIDVYLRHIDSSSDKPTAIERERTGGGILEVPCGRGKCLGINTPILMFDGTIKMVQDVVVGDLLMGDDSTPRKVLTLARGREKMYKVREVQEVRGKTNYVGEEYIVNESHILSLRSFSSEKKTEQDEIIDIPLADYLILPKHLQETLFGYRVPIRFSRFRNEETHQWNPDPYTVGFSCSTSIPYEYKCNIPEIQIQVLAGIIDKFGHFCSVNQIEITTPNPVLDPSSGLLLRLIEDIIFLSRSLGFSIQKNETALFLLIGIHTPILPFRNEINNYYQQQGMDKKKVGLEYKFTVEALGEDDYYGFEIDGNRRFVLGDYTVTHNTVMGLKIISILSKKTLILVHKEFLMNQWIERISEFLPAARVGKIQGPTFDIVEKDIVIGMIQSLYDRTFPTDAFSSFGLTIIDEVHRIGSEEFSKTLFKTITRCMLGISATVERKDGLTCLLYHFIGPKIYSEERKEDTVVEVRAIEFAHPQEEYNVVAYDYKGNVQYSTMVSKISNYVPRSQFLVQVIRDLIRAQPDQQIMVLSHIRALLTFLHDHLSKPLDTNEEGIDVGYYVGGMKKEALEATEKKKVVLATYAMAAEALDIKTLNTLVMVSPKTDIIQSVGRILRMKADGKVIVDIVDTHEVFQNQWKKRRAYYKKCGYGIRYVKSANYVDMSVEQTESWKRVSKPTVSSIMEEEGEEAGEKVCFISPELMEKMEEI